MHFAARLIFFALALRALPASADPPPVRVALPLGLAAGDVTTGVASGAGQKYVTVENVVAGNPSHAEPQSYKVSDFRLLADGKTYAPGVRPGLAALDLSQDGVLEPGRTLRVTVSFLVPASLAAAKLEFTPHWTSDAGFIVDWCCYYP